MSETRKRYLIGDYRLEPEKQSLTRAGLAVHLSKKPFQVLLYLVENRDRYVGRTELLDRFWDGKEVYDDALRKSVGAIRKALEDQSGEPRFIETRWGIGYRYVGPVEEQVVHEERTVAVIEKTRGLRVVVEEEIHDESAVAGSTEAMSASRTGLPSPKRRAKALALAFAAVAVAVGAFLFFSPRSRPPAAEVKPEQMRSVAVLPLKNLTGDAAGEYLSDGITESLIGALSKVEGLKVISRGSAFTFKGRDVDPHEVGRQLGVTSVIEGSVRREADRLRVEVRLVNASDGAVLWEGDTSDRSAGDIFAVEEEVARGVAARLRATTGGGQQLARRHTDSVEAYEAYLEGRYFLDNRTPEEIEKGVERLRQAVKVDPNYALAYAWLTHGYEMAYWFSARLPPGELTAKEKEAAARALSLDDGLAEAHLAMATVHLHGLDLRQAAREQERAVELDPSSAEAHHAYAYCLAELGRGDEAVAEIESARDLDPLNVVMNVDVGEILLYAGRYDEAVGALKHAIEMDPGRPNAHYDLGLVYEHKGMEREAVEEYLKSEALGGGAAAALEEAYAGAGLRGFWRKKFELTAESLKRGYVAPIIMARLHARLGETDRAFDWLEKAYAERSPALADLKVDPALFSLRNDPRYEDFLRRVGL